MSKFVVKRLAPEERDLIVRLRIDFVCDLRPALTAGQKLELKAQTEKWVDEYHQRKMLICYCGFVDEVPACCASLLLFQLPPLPGNPPRLVGHVLNFFTYIQFRRQGYGLAIMEFIKKDAAKDGIHKLELNATAMGEPLYRKTGFYEQEEKALILILKQP